MRDFQLSSPPIIEFGVGSFGKTASLAAGLSASKSCLIIADPFLAQTGVSDDLLLDLGKEGIAAALYTDFSGEPKAGQITAAAELAREQKADLIIGVGGGSALDISKVVACCAAGNLDPLHYALAANPLPANPLKKILIPTTAGTGAETSDTAILSNEQGKKVWVWGPQSKADLALLDPALTCSLPPRLTAWCGFDAFVHAFEASSNRKTAPLATLYGGEALRMITGSLRRAVERPDDLAARSEMILGACYAGLAIGNFGTAIAHNISHALAGLAPIHHGHATILAFEATLPWLVELEDPLLQDAALACGVQRPSELPAFLSQWMDDCGVERRLPDAFAAFDASALLREMLSPENAPMREATLRPVKQADLADFAERIMKLA